MCEFAFVSSSCEGESVARWSPPQPHLFCVPRLCSSPSRDFESRIKMDFSWPSRPSRILTPEVMDHIKTDVRNRSRSDKSIFYPVGTILRLSCELGFRLESYFEPSTAFAEFECSDEDEWKFAATSQRVDSANLLSTTRCVEVRCPALRSPAHGNLRVEGFIFGSLAFYRCMEGFVLRRTSSAFASTSANRVCSQSGHWLPEEEQEEFWCEEERLDSHPLVVRRSDCQEANRPSPPANGRIVGKDKEKHIHSIFFPFSICPKPL